MSESSAQDATLFEAASQLPPEQRLACLREACGGDETSRHRLESLLLANDRARNFMAEPAGSGAQGGPALSLPQSEGVDIAFLFFQ